MVLFHLHCHPLYEFTETLIKCQSWDLRKMWQSTMANSHHLHTHTHAHTSISKHTRISTSKHTFISTSTHAHPHTQICHVFHFAYNELQLVSATVKWIVKFRQTITERSLQTVVSHLGFPRRKARVTRNTKPHIVLQPGFHCPDLALVPEIPLGSPAFCLSACELDCYYQYCYYHYHHYHSLFPLSLLLLLLWSSLS